MCCWVSALNLSSSFLSWFWCWWLLGLSVSSRKSLTLRQWLHPRRCGGRVWKSGQQSRSCQQTSSLPVCVLKYAASVLNLSCLRKLGIVLTRNFIHDPFLLFSWYLVFHLHQHLSHCSEGLKTTFSLVDRPMPLQVFSIFSDTLSHTVDTRPVLCCHLSPYPSPSLHPPYLSHLHSYRWALGLRHSSLSLHSYCLGTITGISVWSGAQTLSYMWRGSGVLSGISCHMHWTLRVPENHTLNQIGGKWNYVVLPCRIIFHPM